MKRVCIIGTGYVGLVSGTCFAELGHNVICVDKDQSKIDTLNAGGVPIYEPGLGPLIKKNRKLKRLHFISKIEEGIKNSDIVFIAVNTPPLPDGGADLSFVEACTREVARYVKKYTLLVEKSTVPVQTGERIKKTLSNIHPSWGLIEVASNPEFLREGSAIKDFLKPDRIVIGVQSKKAEKILRELYAKIKVPIVVTDIRSAEIIKHASNSFLALKISYMNAISQICEKVGADVVKVAEGMGYDTRIGRSFLSAGIGYGGSCFPKDVSAFIKIAEKNGYDFQLLKNTSHINQQQRESIVKKLEDALWTLKDKTIGIWGLSFKPDTDDLRNAPSKDIVQSLLGHGARLKAHDPVAMERMKAIFPQIDYCKTPYEAAKDVDGLLVLTEWDVYRRINLKKLKSLMNTHVVVDGRNIFEPEKMHALGFHYTGVGRGLNPAALPEVAVPAKAPV
ncbi:MAG: UDP-glucose/GDP-mannose dehydrogenase family protein [Elusimicrobia bacterium]|nr:UDP-glucose/GDP-mannose dehydrogenase family protein [Candidatus Obscuribacterium magneticum]